MHAGLVIAKIVVISLGVSIAYQGYRGYQRTNNTELLYVACGFTLISIGSILEGVFYDIMNWPPFAAGMIQSIIVVFGLLVILYSLFAQFDDRSDSD
ncbi:hypothetical protein ACFQL7_28095 [Halocatena marina]|uniref:Uncharacterized protein n=1 Tax=Halocatena marina TaxID=2934937 RepID=A0ABD5YZ81_9EURY